MKVTQHTLKTIKRELDSHFNTFDNDYVTMSFVEERMKSHYVFCGLYSDEKCAVVYKEAIEYLEKRVTEAYDEIAKYINKYLDELHSDFFNNSSYQTDGNSSFTNLAIGAGAGLGAAIILGGPIVWTVAIFSAVAKLIDSSKKKQELINKIRDAAKRMNEAAKEKILEALDLLIIPEPKRVERKTAVTKKKTIETVLTDEQLAIKNFLEERNITRLVHFSPLKNRDSIRRYGICSSYDARRIGIDISINDSGYTNYKLEQVMRGKSDHYVCLSVTDINKDLLARYRYDNKVGRVAIFYIDASILWKEIDKDRIYFNMNATCSQAESGRELKDFEKMFAPMIEQMKEDGSEYFDRARKSDNETTHPRSEIRFEGMIDPKYLLPIEEVY